MVVWWTVRLGRVARCNRGTFRSGTAPIRNTCTAFLERFGHPKMGWSASKVPCSLHRFRWFGGGFGFGGRRRTVHILRLGAPLARSLRAPVQPAPVRDGDGNGALAAGFADMGDGVGLVMGAAGNELCDFRALLLRCGHAVYASG